MATGERYEGLVGGVMPVDGRLDLGLEVAASKEGVEDADPVEVEAVGVGREMLKEIGQGLGGGNAPEVLFPRGHEASDFFIGHERVLEAGADVATVDAGDPSGVGIVGAGQAGERLGENGRGIRVGGRNAFFHEFLQAAAENGQDGKGAFGKKEVTEDLQPDDHEFDGVLSLEGLGVAHEGKGAAGSEGLVKGMVGLHLTERSFEASGKAGELVTGAVADAEDDDAGGEPVGIAPLSVGFGVEAEIHPEIDVGNDGAPEFAVPSLGRPDLFQGGGKVFPCLGGIGRITGPGAAGGELGGGGGQAFGRRASTAFQSTKLRNSSM